jgi:hypothetical protein
MKQLKTLHLTGSGVTPAGIKDLKKALPRTEIHYK